MILVGPISHTGTQYMNFVDILNISLNLSAIYFAHFKVVQIIECTCTVFIDNLRNISTNSSI